MPQTEAGLKAALPTLSPHALGVGALTLCFILLKLSTAFFRLRGAPEHVALLNLLGFLAGITFSAILLPFWARRVSGSPSKDGVLPWRGAFAFFLMLPACYSSALFFATRFSVHVGGDTIQAAFWGMYLPIGLHLFFSHVTPRSQALWFGFAMGMGNLFWAIGVPFLEQSAGIDLDAADKERILVFLLLLRNGVLLLLTGVALLMMCRESPRNLPADREGVTTTRPAALLGLLTAPVGLLYFLNGFSSFTLQKRIAPVGRHGEILNLLLVFLFFLLGLAVLHRKAVLPRLYAATICCLALLPLPRLFPSLIPAHALNLLAELGEQVMLFCAVLALGRLAFGFSFRFPALVCCAAYLSLGMLIPGRLAAMGIHALSGEAVIPCLLLAAAACAVSALALLRAFPLPLPAGPPQKAQPPAVPGDFARKCVAFASAFGLTQREVELLDSVLKGRDRDGIAEELGISERTVRFHLGGLLKKTGMPNRKRLLLFYASWQGGE